MMTRRPADPDRKRLGWLKRLRGAYALNLARLFMIVASIDLLAVGGLSLVTGYTGAGSQLLPQNTLGLALVGAPVLGSVAAAVALWRGRDERSTRLSIQGKVPITGWDRVWQLTGCFTIGLYPTLLVAASIWGHHPAAVAFTGRFSPDLAMSFSMVAGVLVVGLLGERARFAYMVGLWAVTVLFLMETFDWNFREALAGPTAQLGFNLLLVSALTWLNRGAVSLDTATADLEELELATEEQKAAEVARRRADSYIHDNLLSVLSVAGKTAVEPSFLRRAATRALASIETSTRVADQQTVGQLFADIRLDAALWPDDVTVWVQPLAGTLADRKLPGQVAAAIRDATREAAWNSIQHAKPQGEERLTRHVSLRADNNGVQVRVSEGGASTPGASPEEPRHGVTESIIRRMEDAGGQAAVNFAGQGRGTEVRLTWSFAGEPKRHPRPPFRMGDKAVAPVAQTRAVQNLAAIEVLLLVVVLACEAPACWNVLAPSVALCWQAAAAFLLVKRWRDVRLPHWVRAAVFITVGLSNFLALSAIIPDGYPGYAAWSLGSGWMLCIGLLVRVGPALAWSTLAFLGLTTWAWTAVTAQPAALAGSMIAGQAVALAFYTGVVWWAKTTMDSLAHARREMWDLELTRLHHQKTTETIMRRLQGVEANVRPVLEELAAEGRADPALAAAASTLEAELRDEIRAPDLAVPQLVDATREARTRGVEVVLLDDRGADLPERDLARVVACGVATLRAASSGRVVIRLQPAGRDIVATVSGPDGLLTVGPARTKPT